MLTDAQKAQFSIELADFIYTNEAKAIVLLKAVGFDSAELQHVLGISIEAQEWLLTQDHLKQLFDTYDLVAGDDDEGLLKKMGSLSLRVKARLLKEESTPPSMKNSIATEFLDRVHGKARQMVETRSYNLNVGGTIAELDRLIVQEASALGISPDSLKLDAIDVE